MADNELNLSRNEEMLRAIIDETEYSTEYDQSRNEAILQSIIDDTEYTDEAQSRMEALLLELKEKIEAGGTTTQFNETLLADDSSMTGTLDFNGVDYRDYLLLKVCLYDTVSQQDLIQLVVSESLEKVFQYFSSGVCFGEFHSSRFAYYNLDANGNWIKGYSDSIVCKKVYGLTGQECRFSVTNIYRGSSTSAIDQAVSYSGNLSDFDCLVAIVNVSNSDCEPCAYVLTCGEDGSLKEYMSNFANGWNSSKEIFISEHEISSYYWFSIDGIKFS